MKKDYDGSNAKRGDLIPYYLKGKNTPLLYNDVQVVPTDPDAVSGVTFNITGVPQK